MRLLKVYEIGQVWLFPFFLALHGLIWVTTYTSSSIAVYAMKLAFFPFVALGVLAYASQIFRYRKMRSLACLAFILIGPFLVVPFVIPDRLNMFYYVSDAIGVLVCFLSTAIF